MIAGLGRLPDDWTASLSRSLPRRLACHCAIRVWAHGTRGPYSDAVVPELTCAEALKRREQLP